MAYWLTMELVRSILHGTKFKCDNYYPWQKMRKNSGQWKKFCVEIWIFHQLPRIISPGEIHSSLAPMLCQVYLRFFSRFTQGSLTMISYRNSCSHWSIIIAVGCTDKICWLQNVSKNLVDTITVTAWVMPQFPIQEVLLI